MEYIGYNDIDSIDHIIDNYKYHYLDEYIESHICDLKNHIIKEEDIYELSNLLLYKYISERDQYIKYNIEKLYSDIFRYVFRPSEQHYEDIDDIKIDIDNIKDIINDAKNVNTYNEIYNYILKISKEEIKIRKNIYNLLKDEYDGIFVSDNIVNTLNIEKLLKVDIEDYIISKYAMNKSIRKEYCNDSFK